MKKFYGTKNKNIILALLAVLLISLGVLASQNKKEGFGKEGLENEEKKEGYAINPQNIAAFLREGFPSNNAGISALNNFMNR